MYDIRAWSFFDGCANIKRNMFRVSLVGGSIFQKFENIPSILVDGYNFIASIKLPGIIHFYSPDRMAVHSNYDGRAAHAG
jgi:hypothetical protein